VSKHHNSGKRPRIGISQVSLSGAEATALLFNLVSLNVPLSHWRQYANSDQRSGGVGFSLAGKKSEKIAQSVITQLSHNETVSLVALAWDFMPANVRMLISTLASQANCSGNVRKNLQSLNEMLSGKLLKQEFERTYRVRVEGADGARFVQKKVNEAVAGAKRKYQKV